jgi:hypothetical protein
LQVCCPYSTVNSNVCDKIILLTKIETESISASGSDSSLFQKQQPKIIIRDVKGGDGSTQMVISKANQDMVVIGASVGKNGFQGFGSGFEQIYGHWQAQNTEPPDTDHAEDSATQLMDECTPGYARR